MNQRNTTKLADVARDFCTHHEDFNDTQANAAHGALWHQCRDFLPTDATTAVIEHGDGLPLILAADDKHLYAVDVVRPIPEDEPATARAVMRLLDPERCRVEVHTRYRGLGVGYSRHSTWSIRIDDLELEVMTRTDEDGESDDRETLCQHLAKVIGWRFDGVAGPSALERLAAAEAAKSDAA